MQMVGCVVLPGSLVMPSHTSHCGSALTSINVGQPMKHLGGGVIDMKGSSPLCQVVLVYKKTNTICYINFVTAFFQCFPVESRVFKAKLVKTKYLKDLSL